MSSPLRRIVAEELRGSRKAMFVAVASTLLVALADLARPWPLKVIFDQVLLGKPATGHLAAALALAGSDTVVVIVLSASIVLVALVTGTFAYAQVHVTSCLGNEVVCRLRRELFAHLQRLSLSVHHRARSGELLTRMTSDTQALKDTFTESAITLAAQVVTITGCLTIMFLLSWQLTLIVLATLPLLFWNLFRLFRASRAAARHQRSKEETLTTQVSDALSSAQLIRAFGRERHETERFFQRTGEHLAQSIHHARFEAVSARSVEILGATATALVVLFGALEVLGGRMTPGTVLVFSTYLHSLYRPIRQIAKVSTRISAAVVSARRINDVLEMTPDIEDAPDAMEAVGVRGEIAFRDVHFAYGGRPVLRGVSFRIAPGQRVALVGSSGAGKSTIASLLLRLYDAAAGSITVDGVDIRAYRRESFRRSIAVVLQDSLIQGATIRENITYGKPDASHAEVEAAARAARAHTFISRLPAGYDSVVGAGGATLSGGQRRRVAIARAMIRNAPILLLDEPMAGLDRRSQARVQRAIRRAAHRRTCLVITHDLETAAAMDAVLVLDGGRVVDSGTHEELMGRSAEYRRLLNLNDEALRVKEQACA